MVTFFQKCLLSLVFLCFFTDTSIATENDSLREQELSYLKQVMGPDLLPYAKIEISDISQIQKIHNELGNYLGLRVYDKQSRKNKGVRAEISIDYPYQSGDTVEYHWRFMIPSNFQSDSTGISLKNRWWLMGQWHDQPDRSRGENWDNYPSHSPSIAFGYGINQGQDVLSLNYGAPQPAPIRLVPFERNKWQDVRVKIHWSLENDGFISVFFNNSKEPVAFAKGRNMYNNFQHYFKIGMYRHPEIKGDSWFFLDDVRIHHVR